MRRLQHNDRLGITSWSSLILNNPLKAMLRGLPNYVVFYLVRSGTLLSCGRCFRTIKHNTCEINEQRFVFHGSITKCAFLFDRL